MWSSFFRDGGFGMFPTVIFSVLLLGSAVLYARRPERRFVPLLVALGILTLASGCLGFTVGFITTLRAVVGSAAEERHVLTLLGLAESSNNLVLALIGVVLSALTAAWGALSVARTRAV